jgi:hypothetical protein
MSLPGDGYSRFERQLLPVRVLGEVLQRKSRYLNILARQLQSNSRTSFMQR